MHSNEVYPACRKLTREVFFSEAKPEKSIDLLIDFLKENGRDIRENGNVLFRINLFVSDLSSFEMNDSKPFGLGLVYHKPQQDDTQDIFIILPNGKIDYIKKDKDLKKKYPELVGMHKKKLSVVEL